MTAHAYELIGAARDEVLDDASDAFLRVHLRECADCRRYERELSRADRLVAQREPYPAVPPFEAVRRYGERRRWSPLIALAASGVIVVAAIGGLTLRERHAASQPSPAPVLGSALAGAWLGASPDDVVRSLGQPDRRSGEGTQWVYERGLLVLFSGRSLGPSSVVGSIQAWRGSLAQTEEGFRVYSGVPRDFRDIYATFDLDEQPRLGPQRPDPFRLLVARGRDRDGRIVQLLATFSDGRAESLELSRAKDPGEVRLSGTHVLDPFAVSACGLISRAAPRAGYATAAAVSTHADEPKEQVPPDRELNARLCAYGEDRDWADPHLFWATRPVGRADAVRVLTGSPTLPDQSAWKADGDGRWIARACAPGHVVVAASPRCHVAVAASVGPYLFIVYDRNDDAARRLADAVVAELP